MSRLLLVTSDSKLLNQEPQANSQTESLAVAFRICGDSLGHNLAQRWCFTAQLFPDLGLKRLRTQKSELWAGDLQGSRQFRV